MSDEAFLELSLALVNVSPNILHRLLTCLEKISVSERKLWLERYNKLKNDKEDLKTSCHNIRTYIQPRSQLRCYSPKSQILVTFVNNNQTFDWMLDELKVCLFLFLFFFLNFSNCRIDFFICQKVNVIGLDAEWMPVLSYKNPPISILQIATINCCFVIDMLALANNDKISEQYVQQWETFVEQILHNENIVKMGFHSGYDICKLKWSTNRNAICLQNEIDLYHYHFYDYFSFLDPNTPTYSNQLKAIINRCLNSSHYQGLSMMTYIFFGKPLDKMEQKSHWEQRPLRLAQLTYSALDAYCLVDIYMVLSKIYRCLNFISLEQFLDHIKLNY